MNLSTKRQHHEQARKKHRHEKKQYAREAARRHRGSFPKWLLVGGITLMVALVISLALLA